MNAVGNLRFDESNFIPSYDRLQGSPRKRKKRDASEIESRWRIAVENLMQQHDDDNDGLPQAGEAYSSFHSTLSFNKGSSTSSEKAKKGNGEPSSSNLDGGKHREDATVDGWDPLPCDPTLTIPGELVLSREKKDSSIYWPARIEAYLPPTKPLKPGRYTITFFDSAQAVVPREFFFTSDEDGFGNCKVSTLFIPLAFGWSDAIFIAGPVEEQLRGRAE